MKKSVKLSVLKIGIIVLLGAVSCYVAFSVPKAVMGMVPVVQTTALEKYEYCPSVSAKGVIIKEISNIKEAENKECWFAVVSVAEADISRIKTGQTALLSGAALPDGEFKGSVCKIDENAHTAALSASSLPETVVEVTISIESGDTSVLKSGYSVSARLKTGEEKTMSMLPYNAIAQDEKGEFVYVIKDGFSVRKDVVTGIELSDKTEIISGIDYNDQILTYPEKIREGERLRLSKEQ